MNLNVLLLHMFWPQERLEWTGSNQCALDAITDDFTNRDKLLSFTNGSLNSTNPVATAMWDNTYTAINRCNKIITELHKVEAQMDKFAFNMALEEIWILVRRANKYIDEKAPWVLAKTADTDADSKAKLDTVLHNLAEAIRIISILIHPFMNTTSKEIRKQLGLWYADVVWEDAFTFEMMYQDSSKGGCRRCRRGCCGRKRTAGTEAGDRL